MDEKFIILEYMYLYLYLTSRFVGYPNTVWKATNQTRHYSKYGCQISCMGTVCVRLFPSDTAGRTTPSIKINDKPNKINYKK